MQSCTGVFWYAWSAALWARSVPVPSRCRGWSRRPPVRAAGAASVIACTLTRGAQMSYWLMKSEPDTFGIADLERVKIEPWTGVRSFFARAHMRAMAVGDAVLFHHSNATPPGVAGLARVVRIAVV